MFQKLSKKLRKKQGFTLIELIVVLAILGIILAIAVPNYLGVQDSAAEDAETHTLTLLEDGIELWSLSTDGNEAGTYILEFNGTTLTDTTDDTITHNVSSYIEGVKAPTSSTNAAHTDIQVVIAADSSVTATYHTTAP